MLSAVITLGLSALISILSKYHEYKQIMLFAFAISSLLMITSGILNIYYKSLINMKDIQNSRNSENKIKLSKVFCHPVFLHLLIPTLFRGFAYGTVSVLAIVAFDIGFDKSVTTMMVSVQTIATLAGCTVFGMSSKLIRPKNCILFGSLTFLLLPLMLIANKYVFLAVYAIIFFGRTIVDYAVPPYLLRVVPVEISGQYNAWRMILHNGGTLIATSVASVLSPIALFAVTIIFQLISGIGFMIFKAKN